MRRALAILAAGGSTRLGEDKILADLVKVWYESHLRRNRDILIKYLKQTYEKVETFNQ